MEITKEGLDFLIEEIEKQVNLYPIHDIDLTDVLYTMLNPGFILNDWDEGKGNDPFWDEENNRHRAISMIYEVIDSYKKIN